MFEFLNFLGSLIKIALGYLYSRNSRFFNEYYKDLSQLIVRKPKDFIIWPLLLGFILSYPSIFSFYYTVGGFNNSHIMDLSQLNSSILTQPELSSQLSFTDEFVLRQIWLSPNDGMRSDQLNYLQTNEIDPQALRKPFLIESLGLQDQILSNLIAGSTQSDQIFVHSIFNVWSNDINKLRADKTPLKTIHLHTLKNQEIPLNSLLSGVKKINGFIKSVDAFRILILHKSDEKLDRVWNETITQYTTANSSSFKILQNQDVTSIIEHNFLLRIAKVTYFDHVFLSLCYLFILAYFLISISNLSTVRSKAGLLLAYIVQVSLSVLSSATVIKFFFKSVDFNQVPLEFLPFIVVVVSVENMFRVIAALSHMPSSHSIQQKFSAAATESGFKSTLIVVSNLLLLLLVRSFVSPASQIFCLFACVALVVDHVLHLTYFQAILIIDSLRIELSDLIDEADIPKQVASLGFADRRSTGKHRLIETLRIYKRSISLPFATTVTGSLVVVCFVIGVNIRWADDCFDFCLLRYLVGRTDDLGSYLLKDPDMKNYFDRKTFSSEMFALLEQSEYKLPLFSRILIRVAEPLVMIPKSVQATSIQQQFHMDISYSFDSYYVLEFLALLVLVMSLTLMILRYFTASLTNEYESESKFNSKVHTEDSNAMQTKLLSGGHFLDIIKISTASKSPFIVSLGLDHKVLVWSPMSRPLPTPTQLPLSPKSWPITHIVLSDTGNYVAIFSKTGILQCWSRSSKTWKWRVQIDDLKNSVPLESFFRKKSIPAFLQRKKANELLKAATASAERPSNSRRNSMRSVISLNMAPNLNFDNNSGISDSSDEFVVVLKHGRILSISCETGDLKEEKLIKDDDDSLVSSAVLFTPRVNDRLVSLSASGKILVSTAVNNKWKTRTVTIFENQFYLNNSETRKDNNTDITQQEAEQPKINFSKSAIAIVPFVGFMVRACDSFAELVDVQTGVLIMKFPIREFKKNSFKVFHDQPTHCRFCGSASISSFSVVYTLLDTNTVVLHTFRVDHRAKKSICLRVERDVREIRCIGFNSVSQDIYELENVECWSATDNNQIIGVSKKIEEVIRIDDSDSDSDFSEIDAHILRRRGGGKGEPKLKPKDTLAEPSTTPDLWKGWTMTADGKIDYYDIPQNGDSEGLLVNSISQMNKFGHKSIVVAFGNIMKVLYLGNDDLIYTDDNQRPPVNEEISGLSFVNKRRKNLKKDTVNSPLAALGVHDSFNEF